MQKHLVVLDLDGTLLTNDKTIAHQTKQTLLQAKDEGHHVMIEIGRAHV